MSSDKPSEGSQDETPPACSLQQRYDSQNAEAQTEKPKNEATSGKESKSDQPAGGYDSTPIPYAPPGYTVKITFHRAKNLPMADMNSLSSDPYILAQLNTELRSRHKEDPCLRMRTPTIRRSTDPVWNCEWIVANIPATGFKLKARVYDEDPADHDDRLGNVTLNVPSIEEGWEGIREAEYKIRKRMGSKRAYAIQAVARCFQKAKHMHGYLTVSIELLGRTEDNVGGRSYTVGPQWWTRHFSPLLGRMTGRKVPDDGTGYRKKTERYNFQANQFQLKGPVPYELYHRYVEFKPFVKGMFTKKGIRGFLLSKALHHQHSRVYNFNRSTLFETIQGPPSKAMALKFLDLVHYDQGGRIFTYVLTLDALFRFTETGKEFGIDMVSKHTMHSDVSIYIAFSGEFFVRRLKRPYRPRRQQSSASIRDSIDDGHTHPPEDREGGPTEEDPPEDPKYYELIIDNDSGTYRPNAKLLPLLKRFFQQQFVGLKIVTLDCQADAEKLGKMKEEQSDRKEKEGPGIVYTQLSRCSSLSSSDEEALDDVEQGGHNSGLINALGHDASAFKNAKKDHLKVFGPRGAETHKGHQLYTNSGDESLDRG
ncbi:hypothetical protein W97_04295 [Coniosporium apollinis CBS 100218]|uniref:C2 domain-containing protein n=1 Tax=Coniosporium apollinis (strain CBS 100218) TaxID=1168221 RepID=R7YT46_CONA1|nr:uncharacterized protein W97_04295 [Coniosporium apollinis CBS 100218]EON65060.1 hypothetical protein W97_04295 [Coniosporium apollinis CBS 100218]